MGTDAKAELAGLGGRLRELRLERDWTLDELAERSGLSKPFLSRLEGGSRQPSIAAILTLARVFAVSVGILFEPVSSDDSCIVVRAKDAAVRQGRGISYAAMSAGSRFSLQPMRVAVRADRVGDERFRHEGEEWLYVLSGRVKLSLGEREYIIESGDAAHFDSRLPHRLDALDGSDASVILVACPIPIARGTRRHAERTMESAAV